MLVQDLGGCTRLFLTCAVQRVAPWALTQTRQQHAGAATSLWGEHAKAMSPPTHLGCHLRPHVCCRRVSCAEQAQRHAACAAAPWLRLPGAAQPRVQVSHTVQHLPRTATQHHTARARAGALARADGAQPAAALQPVCTAEQPKSPGRPLRHHASQRAHIHGLRGGGHGAHRRQRRVSRRRPALRLRQPAALHQRRKMPDDAVPIDPAEWLWMLQRDGSGESGGGG